MKYNVGDKVRVKSIDWYNQNKDSRKRVALKNDYYFTKEMARFCDAILTIEGVCESQNLSHYSMKEVGYAWTDDMIEGLAEFIHHITLCAEGIHVADGFEFQDENGNIINARKVKIVKKKPKYPVTYEECCEVLNLTPCYNIYYVYYRGEELDALYQLLVCRDAYWKIAGYWEPDWGKNSDNYNYNLIVYEGEIIKDFNCGVNHVLSFPTEEMRDAFYENFKDLIEQCKELL